jgi:virulence-associated protein VagC
METTDNMTDDRDWEALLEILVGFTDDFMEERDQPPVQHRD